MPETITKFPAIDYTEEFLADNAKAQNGQKIPRRLLITYLNLGELYRLATVAKPTRFIGLGRGVEDSSLEFNPDTEKVTDIFGNTETTVNKIEIAQNFSPVTLRVGSELHKIMLQILDEKDFSRLSTFDILVVKAFWAHTFNGVTYFPAELHRNCTVTPQSLGGSNYVDMPINTDLSNDKLVGWASISEDENGNKTATFYEVGADIPEAEQEEET